jgi:hypothetical protein
MDGDPKGCLIFPNVQAAVCHWVADARCFYYKKKDDAAMKDDIAVKPILRMSTTTPPMPVTPSNQQRAREFYKFLAEGDIRGIAGVFADASNGDVVMYTDRGMMKFGGIDTFIDTMLSRIAQHWPSFKISVGNVLMETSNQVLLKLHATTDNGMDTDFFHYWKFDATGKAIAWWAADDSVAWAKYDVNPEAPTSIELGMCGKGGEGRKASSTNPTYNEKTVRAIYEMLAMGTIIGVAELFADPNKGDVVWVGDAGTVRFHGWNDFVDRVLSSASMNPTMMKLVASDVVMETSNKILFRSQVTTENGMNTDVLHIYEFNAKGEIVALIVIDDGVSSAKYLPTNGIYRPNVSVPKPTEVPTPTPTDDAWTQKGPCVCMDIYDHKGVTYQGCAKSPDFDSPWCYVVGGTECPNAKDSNVVGETKKYRTCKDPCECQSSWWYMDDVYAGCASTPDKLDKWCFVTGGALCKSALNSTVKGEERRYKSCKAPAEVTTVLSEHAATKEVSKSRKSSLISDLAGLRDDGLVEQDWHLKARRTQPAPRKAAAEPTSQPETQGVPVAHATPDAVAASARQKTQQDAAKPTPPGAALEAKVKATPKHRSVHQAHGDHHDQGKHQAVHGDHHVGNVRDQERLKWVMSVLEKDLSSH